MKRLGVTVASLGLMLAVTGASAPNGYPLDLEVGHVQRVDMGMHGPVAQMTLGNPQVVEVIPLEHFQLNLRGRGVGETVLHVRGVDGDERDYRVRVH